MEFKVSTSIITHQILNEATGELESKSFAEQSKIIKVRGGYSRMYKDYDTAVSQVIKSNKDYELLILIRDMFTYRRIEVVVSATDIAKKGYTRSKVLKVIKGMADVQMLRRVARGTYRLNPFMYLPYKADAEDLQTEWNKLIKTGDQLNEK